ncbi:MAG: twin-arginine translocation pathway signal [Alphaproteobacteria bacterium]
MRIVAATMLAVALWFAAGVAAGGAQAADAAVIDARVDAALTDLRQLGPGTAELLDEAAGVLVMPRMTKGGFILGGQYGEGVLRVDGETVAYYSLAAGSLGLLAGVETFSQALLFMTPEALAEFRAAAGWRAGAGTEVTLLREGFDINTSTDVANRPIIAIVFGQNGLLAGASVEGAKYTRIER